MKDEPKYINQQTWPLLKLTDREAEALSNNVRCKDCGCLELFHTWYDLPQGWRRECTICSAIWCNHGYYSQLTR